MRNSNLAERLGLYIETAGISQKELSKISGVSDSVICRAIKGHSTLSADNIVKIVDALGISPSWLLGYGNDEDIERM